VIKAREIIVGYNWISDIEEEQNLWNLRLSDFNILMDSLKYRFQHVIHAAIIKHIYSSREER
jgi:hypothetical protein